MTHNPPLFLWTSGEGSFESMSYIQAVSRCVNTSCCRNTIESEVRSALLTTTSFSIDSVPLFFFFFFDILIKICFSLSVSAEIFVSVVPPPPILHRPVCKRQRMLHVDHVTWPSAGVTPPLWLQMCFYGHWCVRISPSVMNRRHGQVDEFLPLCFDFMVWNISFGSGVRWYLIVEPPISV